MCTPQGNVIATAFNLLDWSSFYRSCKDVSRKFQGCFTEVSRVLWERSKGVSRKFQWCFRKVAWMLHESFKVFQGSFMKTFRVFQNSFMLHGTHRSFPSRRRACFCLNDQAYNCLIHLRDNCTVPVRTQTVCIQQLGWEQVYWHKRRHCSQLLPCDDW